ncbi:hypothetical protein SISSUDRAFT_190533 [Sistotremastrum suecicum HHB10207 ss-3]|uniref:Cytosolic endo-beta-N-acetylglucosaminidase TIM barrel domain-containing protein n=1 Tax=Sistotremastrum suecicum HHB10207 ss-3 TaxID=1314776 RepID=A0A166ADS6_9AGAM|nr:hypothetical protein SISSUDRAFT_190533 [Sistotremastrum suecicum HHB10207 ss-3]
MPLNTQLNITSPAHPPHFKSLLEFEEFLQNPDTPYPPVLPYIPPIEAWSKIQSDHGKLLVCHDYKGNYKEVDNPDHVWYTFNFWWACDTFVYFAHDRITIPPPGWIIAAHRQGSKILGTLIFEHTEDQKELLQLLTGPTATPASDQPIPLSRHYAKALARLAAERGFDGWLLNLEYSLSRGRKQAYLTTAWVELLRQELVEAVGPHAQAVWYDALDSDGDLDYGEQLDGENLPYFLASDLFFVDYSWWEGEVDDTIKFFNRIDKSALGDKKLSDIFFGIYVFNDGYNTYKRIQNYLQPSTKKLSAAIFAPGWTWENMESKGTWTWQGWWDHELRMWMGPSPPSDVASDSDYKPLSDFVPLRPSPNPRYIPYMTTFCLGAGHAWHVEGTKVLQTGTTSEDGWTDVEKQTSLGDLLWPTPRVLGRRNPLPWTSWSSDGVTGEIYFDDAWLGGSSVKLSLDVDLQQQQPFGWAPPIEVAIPISSLSLTPNLSYQASITYKMDPDMEIPPVVSIFVDTVSDNGNITSIISSPFSSNSDPSPTGWITMTTTFMLASQSTEDFIGSIGVRFWVPPVPQADPSLKLDILVGQISVAQAPPDGVGIPQPLIISAEFDDNTASLIWESGITMALPAGASGSGSTTTTSPGSSTPSSSSSASWEDEEQAQAGVLVAQKGRRAKPNKTKKPQRGRRNRNKGKIPSESDSTDTVEPQWSLDDSKTWYPKFAYFNIFAQLTSSFDSSNINIASLVFVGTSGVDGEKYKLTIGDKYLATILNNSSDVSVTYFIQGVTDRGAVLDPEYCATVVIAAAST